MQDLKQQHANELTQIDAQLYRLLKRRDELAAILATLDAVEAKRKDATAE